MKLVAKDAVVVLTGTDRHPPLAGQRLSIFKSSDAVIGIDGHTAFQDQVVEVRWEGLHQRELADIRHVEIREGSGNLLESLPLDSTRPCYEKDGDTYFYLRDSTGI